MASHVSNERSFVSEPVRANAAGERPFSGMSSRVIDQVNSRLELLSALEAIKVSDVVVLSSNVSFEATRLAETLVAVLATNLSSDSVSPQMIAKRISIGVTFVTNVTLSLLAFVRVLVNPGRRPVVEPGRAPVAEVSSVKISVVSGVTRSCRHRLLDVRRRRVSRDVKPEMSTQVLTIRKTFETGQTNQTFSLVVVQLLFSERQAVLGGHNCCPLLQMPRWFGASRYRFSTFAIARFTVARTI